MKPSRRLRAQEWTQIKSEHPYNHPLLFWKILTKHSMPYQTKPSSTGHIIPYQFCIGTICIARNGLDWAEPYLYRSPIQFLFNVSGTA